MASKTTLLACLLLSAGAAAASNIPATSQADLAAGFRNPPAKARPHTWWHWMNGNISKEGITADLEAMKEIGLGGAQIFNVSESIPKGPIDIMSPQWREMIKFAAAEADRLGLELCMHNCPGWSSSGGPWITPEHAMQVVASSQTVVQGPLKFSANLDKPKTRVDYYRDIAVLAYPTPAKSEPIKNIAVKNGADYQYNQQPATDAIPAEAVVKKDSIVDLTSKLTPDGHLDWDVPAGSWTILRIGHTPTGAVNAPSPDSGRGLECDKLSRDGLDAHWAGMMGPVLKDLGPLAGKTLNNCLIDSYEVGGQNWTPRFREEFTKRRGYDPLTMLPAMTGQVVESGEISERFLWDVRRTIADLFADNYYTYFAQICKKNGLSASIEPYDGPFECLLSGRDADIPMGEFWVGGAESTSCKLAASVAHIYGRSIVGAESFTAEPNTGRWMNDPASLKGIGDLMYTVGINRYIIHRYAHQPWMNVYPGMTMGQWGTHFERTTTWWNQGSGWISYLARCQYLLQQGLFNADVCYFTGDAAPNNAPMNLALKAGGYDYDAVNADVLIRRATIKNGRITMPDGMNYGVMVLPDITYITPPTLERIRDLVKDGAIVIGNRPSKSPSLSGYPACDSKVQSLGQEMWGDIDGVKVKEHAVGKGKIISGKSPEEVLAAAGVGPDCSFTSATGKVAWIHRTIDDAQVYFVSNQSTRSQDLECSFRITGQAPEFWDAETGKTEAAPVWHEEGGRTIVPVHFDGHGSVFVVFRKAAAKSDHLVSMTPPEMAAPPKLPAITIVKAVYEASDGAGKADVTDKVAAMVKSGQLSIPANNEAYGDPAFNHYKRLRVDFTVDSKPVSKTVEENQPLDLIDLSGPGTPATYLVNLSPKGLTVTAFKPGVYEFRTASGNTAQAPINSVPTPIEIKGSWQLHFPPSWGAPESTTLDSLASWTSNSDAGVRYFSGTAEYRKEFDLPAALVSSGTSLFLDLGAVKNIAQVTLNGVDLGTWWKPPFSGDITAAAKAGKNTLVIKVTNLWVDRLIGDEQLPDDCEWNGKPIKAWPQWFKDHTPRPSAQRLTFTTWKHYTKQSPLIDSGLLGPVMIRPAVRMEVAIPGP